ncbi:MAG: flavodoxin family protein [Tannerella sp.]|jgi:multimeric flavodoxin WrbA|nr:flavodoxin family protein [Tannerella sp.]
MKKNVLVLTGSPRSKGNSNTLADAFIEGLQTAGHTVERFDAGKKKIKGCIACQKCYSKDGMACIYGDDFNELAPMIERADMFVLVTPLYWFTFPAQVKTAIDKMYALMVGQRDLKIKSGLLMCCAETDDMVDFEGIVRSWELISNYLKWESPELFLVPHVNEPGDILKTDALVRAKLLAERI